LQVTGAIQQAAATTGASFEYLLAAAKIESNLNPRAAASTSSARGLYQFIEQTWFATLKERGAELGYGRYANAISRLDSGRYVVNDPAARQTILNLRNDPAANAAMAGALTQMNGEKLASAIGRAPTDGELYMAHFLGVGGAGRLINTAMNNPSASAARLFPAAAAANRSIFYSRGGMTRSASDVYAVLNSRYVTAANAPATRAALANAVQQPQSILPDAASSVFLSAFPANTASASAAPVSATSPASETAARPVFRTLYQGGERSEPVSPAVQGLWSRGANPITPAATANVPPASNAPSSGFDLFSDRAGIFAG
jgi:predicted component of type VI protein secretion system